MSISMSFTLINRYAPVPVAAAPVAAAPAGSVERAPAPAPVPGCAGDDCQATQSAPRDTLYDAMLSAIDRLGAPSPAPATTPSETSPAPATEPSGDVRNAVYQFADALFQALDSGSGRQSDVEHDERKHHGSERSQQVSHGRNGLAHRLAALARQLRDDGLAAAPPQTPVAPPPVTDPAPADGAVDATPVPTTPAPSAPTPGPTAPTQTTPAAPTAPAVPVSSPLADAFAGLVDALHPAAQTASASTDLVSRLASFLHQLAGTLQSAPI
ncbi:MAG TPA: hypothetical protein VKI18_00495, partial [Albitalea sp.]|nr:hypothetical protein [Albitalea sp.]